MLIDPRILEDVKAIVVKTVARNPAYHTQGVAMTAVVGALRGSWRSHAERPDSGRRWSLNTWRVRELEDAIEASDTLTLVKVYDKQSRPNGNRVLRCQYVNVK